MKHIICISAVVLVACLCLCACSGERLSGSYRAADADTNGPQAIDRITFTGSTIAMESEEATTEATYRLNANEDVITIITPYGQYDYSFSKTDSGITIDAVEYQK